MKKRRRMAFIPISAGTMAALIASFATPGR
jgi:hypothetical protein